jgi:GNAT superfamily N-acetyltransferase
MEYPFTERPATSGDYPHFARLFPELGVPDPIPTQARWDEDLSRRSLFLEALGGSVVGYGLWAVQGSTGYVINVVVDPAWRQRGAGAAVMEALAARLAGLGLTEWCLNVKTENLPAIRLYERFGFEQTYASTAFSLDWERVARLPREATVLAACPCDPADDAALEAAFRKPPGRLAFLRAQPGRVCLRLVDPAHPGDVRLGVASFDPAFPGTNLFAVARPTLAAPLLEALHPYAAPGEVSLKLVVEDDAALASALRGAGAEVLFEFFNMRGEIPRCPLSNVTCSPPDSCESTHP